MARASWEALVGTLDRFSPNARWRIEREPAARVHVVSYRCTSGRLMVTDRALEDAIDPNGIIIAQCRDMFLGEHSPRSPVDVERVEGGLVGHVPHLICDSCGHDVPVEDTHAMTDEQLQVYSEDQALRWMDRAARAGLRPFIKGRAPYSS